jgi:hypothetical protein
VQNGEVVRTAIGTGLGRMYEHFVRSPFPERLTELLKAIDERGRSSQFEDTQKLPERGQSPTRRRPRTPRPRRRASPTAPAA